MKKFCEYCGRETETTVRPTIENYNWKGENIIVKSMIRFCDRCGSEMFDEELDQKTLEKVKEIYVKKSQGAPNGI